jgi:hypothetical protein
MRFTQKKTKMSDEELKKLAVYIVNEITKPRLDMTDSLGYHLMFFTEEQFEDFERMSIKHEIEQLDGVLKSNLDVENYEVAAMILKKINSLKEQIKL